MSQNEFLPQTTGGLMMLREILSKVPQSEKKIAQYILDHPQEAIRCTANELGKRSSTSGAAVIRLCKSMGLSGFQDLKIRVAGDLHHDYTDGYRDIQPNESYADVLAKITNNNMQAIRETSEVINLEALSGCVQALMKANAIHFFGVGASAIIAEDAQQKLLRINKQATAFTDVHVAAIIAANVTADDVVMGISHSGETKEVAEVLSIARENGATIISLTGYGSNTVSNLAHYSLATSTTKEAPFRSGATSSRLAQLHVIDVLFMCVASQQYDQTIQYLDQTRAAVTKIRD